MAHVGLITSPISPLHTPPATHPESPCRYTKVLAHIHQHIAKDTLIEIPATPATIPMLQWVHTPSHIQLIQSTPPLIIDQDTFLGDHSFAAACSAAGAIPSAIDAIQSHNIQSAFCLVRPPGHHAEPDQAMGFCLINNIAVGARYAQKKGYSKVAIIDFDVHHGNGTETIFRSDLNTLFISTHQSPFYPGTGQSSYPGTLNITCPAGITDNTFLQHYHHTIPDAIAQFKPNLILISAGYDIHIEDPIGGFQITDAGIEELIKAIQNMSPKTPKIYVLEGGYNIAALSRSVTHTLHTLINHPVGN